MATILADEFKREGGDITKYLSKMIILSIVSLMILAPVTYAASSSSSSASASSSGAHTSSSSSSSDGSNTKSSSSSASGNSVSSGSSASTTKGVVAASSETGQSEGDNIVVNSVTIGDKEKGVDIASVNIESVVQLQKQLSTDTAIYGQIISENTDTIAKMAGTEAIARPIDKDNKDIGTKTIVQTTGTKTDTNLLNKILHTSIIEKILRYL